MLSHGALLKVAAKVPISVVCEVDRSRSVLLVFTAELGAPCED